MDDFEWEYSFAHLAWHNTRTGEWSETDPNEKITLIEMTEEQAERLQKSHDWLVDGSKDG